MPNWLRRSLSSGISAGTALFTFAVNVAWNVCAVIGASILIGAVFV
ncbi:putative membrane protein [Synechococcus sp. A15-24]|nr:putative membrane protein [Synechococcus sp. A15-24]